MNLRLEIELDTQHEGRILEVPVVIGGTLEELTRRLVEGGGSGRARQGRDGTAAPRGLTIFTVGAISTSGGSEGGLPRI